MTPTDAGGEPAPIGRATKIPIAPKPAREPSGSAGVMTSTSVAEMLESVVGCKWSMRVLSLIRRGINRPGAMTRATPGLSTKVLSERLAKLVRFGIVRRESFAELPPRVEYALTAFGARFATLVDEVERLEASMRAVAPDAVTGGEKEGRRRSGDQGVGGLRSSEMPSGERLGSPSRRG